MAHHEPHLVDMRNQGRKHQVSALNVVRSSDSETKSIRDLFLLWTRNKGYGTRENRFFGMEQFRKLRVVTNSAPQRASWRNAYAPPHHPMHTTETSLGQEFTLNWAIKPSEWAASRLWIRWRKQWSERREKHHREMLSLGAPHGDTLVFLTS